MTVMLMDEGMDTGPILATVETAIEPEEDAGSLGARLAELGAPLLVETLARSGRRHRRAEVAGPHRRHLRAEAPARGADDRLAPARRRDREEGPRVRPGSGSGHDVPSRAAEGARRASASRVGRGAADAPAPGSVDRGGRQPAGPRMAGSGRAASRSRRPDASGCPARNGRAARGSSRSSASDEPERPAGGARGHPPCRRRGRVLEPPAPVRPRTRPAWTPAIARSRPSSPTERCDTCPSSTRRSARAPRDRSPG